MAARTTRILLVEDDDDIRATVLEVLEDEGYAAAAAHSGAAALALLRTTAEKPDFILLDLMMPGMSGSEFHHERLKDPALAQIPLVILSAAADAEASAAKLGAIGCVMKPIKLRALLEALKGFSHTRPAAAIAEPSPP